MPQALYGHSTMLMADAFPASRFHGFDVHASIEAARRIAHRLNISSRTVDKHLEHAYPKLRVSGRVEAAKA